MNTPSGLQNKVFIDFMLYFCNRGRENSRDIKKSDFIICDNNEYIVIKDHKTKNHAGDLYDDNKSQGGRIYKILDNPNKCSIVSFQRYLPMLNPESEDFWQRPKHPSKLSDVWFDNVLVGKNTVGDKMKTLSGNVVTIIDLYQ